MFRNVKREKHLKKTIAKNSFNFNLKPEEENHAIKIDFYSSDCFLHL